VPRGYDDVDGAKRENGAETVLPDTAAIGLADTVTLHFGVSAGPTPGVNPGAKPGAKQ
jgi:hypothetical protein